MPTTRRSTANTRGRAAPAKGQSILSFNSRVTKSVPKDTKEVITSPSVTKVDLPRHTKPIKEEKVEEVIVDQSDTAEPEAEETEEHEAVPEIEKAPEKPDAELRAEKISDAQINKYWRGIEKQRIAPRVHQQEVSQSEKMLRYFDVSSQYGPCIGIDRMKRWYRAERLGLNPPIEVLAVLLREEKKGTEDVETAQIDYLMNATAVGA